MNITDRLDRRDLLKSAGQAGAGLIGAGALAAMTAAPVAADDNNGNNGNNGSDTQHGIVGAWIDDVTPNGTVGVPHQVITLYTPGGGVSATGNQAPGALFGVWVQTGDREFAITFLGYAFTPQGALVGTIKIRISATLGPGNDQMMGHALVEFSQDGIAFFPTGTTTFTSRRIKVEPI